MFEMKRKYVTIGVLIIVIMIGVNLIGQPKSPAQNDPVIQSRNIAIDSLKQQIEKLNQRINSEMALSEKRLEVATISSDQAFTMIYTFGAVGSFLGGVFLVITWVRAQRAREDYRHEREFYEARIMEYARRQEETHIRAAQFDKQQLALGDTIVSKSSDMLSKQIDSIGKLGAVIGLVQQTFKMQLEREKSQKVLQLQLNTMDDMISTFKNHFMRQYDQINNIILTFKDHSRLEWTHLSMYEQTITARARMSFETIPEFILEEKKNADAMNLARVNQLLGVSAYYANDIDAAMKYLKTAYNIYSASKPPIEERYPYAFCCHFLGLIEKNWLQPNRKLELHISDAKKHFEEANKLLDFKKGEILTPLTLVEVLSYSENTRPEALQRLNNIINQLEKIKSSKNGLDSNQKLLLGRAYLFRGNLEYLENKFEQSYEWYQRSANELEHKHYALLSMALSLSDDKSDERMQCFQNGLEALELSDALRKSEDSVRVIALVWAVVAAHELKDDARRRRYLKEFSDTIMNMRSVGNRKPLFFCPLTKNLVTKEQLNQNLIKMINK
ncbi:hypothetical protein JW960_00310 [candidate division KSB1 bacterium]|nr:hypothetical protein [candidate division KSB1 bacterium]